MNTMPPKLSIKLAFFASLFFRAKYATNPPKRENTKGTSHHSALICCAGLVTG